MIIHTTDTTIEIGAMTITDIMITAATTDMIVTEDGIDTTIMTGIEDMTDIGMIDIKRKSCTIGIFTMRC